MSSDPSAAKRYLIETADFDAGDITTGTFVDANFGGGLRINYFKVGKLYFGFTAVQVSNGEGAFFIGATSGTIINDSANRIANQLGITINAAYQSSISPYGNNSCVHYDIGSSLWIADSGVGFITNSLQGILAN